MVCRRACLQWRRRSHRPRQRHALAMAGACGPKSGRALTLLDIVLGRRCGPDPRRRPRAAAHDAARARPAARGRPRLPRPARLPRSRAPRHRLRAGARPAAEEPARPRPHARAEARLTRALPVGALRHRHRRRRRLHRQLQCGLHAHVLRRGPRRAATIADLVPDGDEARAASSPRRCSAPSRAAPAPPPSRSPSARSASSRAAST